MKLFNHTKPKERFLYAITNGTMMGVCLLFTNLKNTSDDFYSAIAIGDKDMDGGMDALQIPKKDVIDGLKIGILEKIKKVPPELYSLCCMEYDLRMKKKASLENESTD